MFASKSIRNEVSVSSLYHGAGDKGMREEEVQEEFGYLLMASLARGLVAAGLAVLLTLQARLLSIWILPVMAAAATMGIRMIGAPFSEKPTEPLSSQSRSSSSSSSTTPKPHASKSIDDARGKDVLAEVEECMICLEDLVSSSSCRVTTLPCGHKFHEACVKRWLCRSSRCPLRCSLSTMDAATYASELRRQRRAAAQLRLRLNCG
mmetsp:Transcript_1547/g.3278  ORF Transcript_1547/g.3278 Transcript_1547/m.3278 type:complete len:206 (-) Transcript_1547:351-968(-)